MLHPSPKAKVSPGIKSLPLYGQAQTLQHSPSGAGNTLALAAQVGHAISLNGRICEIFQNYSIMSIYV